MVVHLHRSAPPKLLVAAMNLLLFVTAHEPVEAGADEVHQYGQGVKHVVTGLGVQGRGGGREDAGGKDDHLSGLDHVRYFHSLWGLPGIAARIVVLPDPAGF